MISVPEAGAMILIYLIVGGLIAFMRREYLTELCEKEWEKATAQSILLTPVWPIWVAYHIVRWPIIGIRWCCHHAFKEDK